MKSPATTIQLLKTESDTSTKHPPRGRRFAGASSGYKKFETFIKPMLAKMHDKPFDNEDWLFEIKWDGYRAIAEIDNGKVRLYSRNGLTFEKEYPIIYKALSQIKGRMILDGEIVAFGEHGQPSFQLLQQYGTEPDIDLRYEVFDCLAINGESIEDEPLLQRKEKLRDLLPASDVIRYCDHVLARGKDFFALVKEQGLEGMIAKRAASAYIENSRNGDWLKVKHLLIEEAVIAGYTAPGGSRKFFGALVLGIYNNGELIYIGHTGTGFSDKLLKELYNTMQPLVTSKSPFKEKVPVNAPVIWVKPKLVCNVKYTEVTGAGHRRHPVFMGLRVDKAAEDTTITPLVAKQLPTIQQEQKNSKTTAHMDKKMPKTKVSISHPDKVYWPDEGYTKGDVIRYYDTMYKVMGKYLKGRPQSLYRTPEGINAKGFFHKDAGDIAPEFVDHVPIYSESNDKDIDYILCNNKDTLLYLANLGCIEINPWCSTIDMPDHPDFLVLDLDPSDENTFNQVIETAQVIYEILSQAGVTGYPKTSGATGIHIYVPLGARYHYDEAKEFAHVVAMLAHEQLPGFTSLERSLAKRGKDKLYIDYLQNRRGQTLAAPYSLRPKPGATVSAPLRWEEVKPGLHPSQFHIGNMPERMDKAGDVFVKVIGKGIDMQKCLKNLGA